MATTYGFTVNIVMVINIAIKKKINIHDLVKKIVYWASTYNFAVNTVMVINITINKTFGIHDLLKIYSCCNLFSREDINTFNVLTFVQACSDKNKFPQIRNIDTFSILTFVQARKLKNNFMQIKNGHKRVRIYFYIWFVWTFDLLEVNKKTTKFLAFLNSVSIYSC